MQPRIGNVSCLLRKKYFQAASQSQPPEQCSLDLVSGNFQHVKQVLKSPHGQLAALQIGRTNVVKYTKTLD
jgi:hypothetical protein